MYERAGREEFFEELTRRFYGRVATDPVLRPVYPEDDSAFEAARTHLRDFLVQHFGGPRLYRQRRGDPRLTERHAHLAIGAVERDAWLRHMEEAVRAGGLRPLDQTQMLAYFRATAAHLMNRPESGSRSSGAG